MMRPPIALLVLLCVAACGQERALVAEQSSVNAAGLRTTGVARNRGTQVWLVPVPAGDLMKLAQHPELWPVAQQRIDVVSLYLLHAYHHDGFECGTPCGPNTYGNLLEAVPGGMFRWLSERFELALEAGSVKSHSCTESKIRTEVGLATAVAIDNIKKAGGRLSYLSMDEPFASGTGTAERSPFGSGYVGCGLSAQEVARLQLAFNETIHAAHPEVQIGFLEPYPHFSPDEIMSFMLELEHAGIPIPYFHLDLYLQAAVRQKRDVVGDMRRLREFFRSRGIPFGIIVFGEDGKSNRGYSTDAWAAARMMAVTTGVTEHTVFQSWAESTPGDLNSRKDKPDTVPETDPFTHTGLVVRILEFLGVEPAP